MKRPFRAWINQPQSHHPLNHLHGTKVLAITEASGYGSTVYFLTGDIVSMLVPNLCISLGWPKHLSDIPPKTS